MKTNNDVKTLNKNRISDIHGVTNPFRRMLKKLEVVGRPIASCFLCSGFLVLAVWTVSAGQRSSGSSQQSSGVGQGPSGCELPPNNAYATTVQYVETFYPLWFTYNQSVVVNRLVGPERVSPLYHSVVMINDDTVYCSAFLNLDPTVYPSPAPSPEPVMILTVPSTVSPDMCSPDTSVTYSILILSPYGDVYPVSTDPCAASPTPAIPHGAPPITGGTYALVGPDYTGTPPPGTTLVQLPWNYPTIIFRSDKYHSFEGPSDYVNQISQANQFRSLLQLQTLSDWENCPIGGFADVKPEFPDFAVPYKTTADDLIAKHPIQFLRDVQRGLQTAVHSPRTPPNACADALSAQFDALFGNGNWKDNSPFGRGAQAAHDAIVNNYVNGHQVGNNWTHFTNIGNWDPDNISISNAIDRSSITEFCQFCNDINSAGYYHAFNDGQGRALKGDKRGYVLTFPPAAIGGYPGPETTRFWSLTAYTPQAIELIPNEINRYEVASYSGAHLNPDGSLSIYMATEAPDGIPIENWLPVGDGPFNVVLRDYGPPVGGSVVCDTYIPPAIQKRH